MSLIVSLVISGCNDHCAYLHPVPILASIGILKAIETREELDLEDLEQRVYSADGVCV